MYHRIYSHQLSVELQSCHPVAPWQCVTSAALGHRCWVCPIQHADPHCEGSWRAVQVSQASRLLWRHWEPHLVAPRVHPHSSVPWREHLSACSLLSHPVCSIQRMMHLPLHRSSPSSSVPTSTSSVSLPAQQLWKEGNIYHFVSRMQHKESHTDLMCHKIFYTWWVMLWHCNRWHEDGQALALALQGCKPPPCTKGEARAQKRLVKLVHGCLMIFCMLNPSDLQCKCNFIV